MRDGYTREEIAQHLGITAGTSKSNLGGALRQKLTKRTALTADYYYLFPGNTAANFRNALGLGLGVDIETGGHVFQLHVTNSLGMTEKFFVPETTGRFFAGDLYFGFAVVRNFTVGGGR